MSLSVLKTEERNLLDLLESSRPNFSAGARWGDSMGLYTKGGHSVSNIFPSVPAVKPAAKVATKDLLRPLSELKGLQDGLEALLYCEGEQPALVHCTYRRVMHEDEIAWEGWAYTDQILCDLHPNGPAKPTHYCLNFSPDKSPQIVEERNRRQTKDVRHFNKSEFTAAQLIRLYELDLDPRTVRTRTVATMELPEITVEIRLDADEKISPAQKVKHRPMPIIEARQSGSKTIFKCIDLNGDIMEVFG